MENPRTSQEIPPLDEEIAVVSSDPVFKKYGIQRIPVVERPPLTSDA